MGTARLQADVGNWIVHATFWTSALFVPVVSTYWQWWRHFYARMAVSIDMLLTLGFLGGEIGLLLGHPPAAWVTWLTLAAFAVVPVRTVFLAVAIWRLQRRERRSARPG